MNRMTNDRPDGERLSRYQALKAIERKMEFNPSNNVIKLCLQAWPWKKGQP